MPPLYVANAIAQMARCGSHEGPSATRGKFQSALRAEGSNSELLQSVCNIPLPAKLVWHMPNPPRYKLGTKHGTAPDSSAQPERGGSRSLFGSHAAGARAMGSAPDRASTQGHPSVDLALAMPRPTGTPGIPTVLPEFRRPAWWSSVVLADAVSLAACFVIGALARQPLGQTEGPSLIASLAVELPFIPLYLLTMAMYGLYQRDKRRLRSASFMDIGPQGHALALGAILTMAVSAGLHRFIGVHKVGWVEAIFMSLPATVLVPAARSALRLAARRQTMRRSRVLILGSGSVAASLARRLSRCAEVELVGFVDDDPHPATARNLMPYRGSISDLPLICLTHGVDRVLVAFSQCSPKGIAETLRALPPRVSVSVVPRLFELVTWQSRFEELHGLTVMDIAPPRLDVVSRAVKRAMDVAISAGSLLFLSPALLAIAAAVKVSSPGPVFFRQDRVGCKGKTFQIFKFRTMREGADEVKIDLRDNNDVDGPLFKIHNDPRVTNVGRFLRTTSLDELPQLINVLKGNMSLVGPRPFVPDESAGIDGWAKRRFDVRPGMTGLWQISGRNDLPFEELRQLDYAYVASWSLWWDLKILWHTPGTVLRRQGAY